MAHFYPLPFLLPLTSYRLPLTSYRFPLTSYLSPPTALTDQVHPHPHPHSHPHTHSHPNPNQVHPRPDAEAHPSLLREALCRVGARRPLQAGTILLVSTWYSRTNSAAVGTNSAGTVRKHALAHYTAHALLTTHYGRPSHVDVPNIRYSLLTMAGPYRCRVHHGAPILTMALLTMAGPYRC